LLGTRRRKRGTKFALKRWEEAGGGRNRPPAPMGPGNPHEPTTLFNGMIAPLMKYTIRAPFGIKAKRKRVARKGAFMVMR
jgi:hypothetical protein